MLRMQSKTIAIAAVLLASGFAATRSAAQGQQLVEVASYSGGFGDQVSRVANGGNLLGSGRDELLIGAPSDNGDTGYARLVRGYQPNGFHYYSALGSAGSGMGASLAAGDYNGDGIRDMAAGAPGFNSRTGQLRVVLSPASGVPTVINFHAGITNWQLGASLATIGDLDAVPGDELVVGAPWADNLTGRVQVHRIENNSVTQLFEPGGENAGDQFGFSAAGVGDVDGGGKPDFVVGAPFADLNGVDAGSVYLFSGETFQRLARFDGQPGDRLGISLAAAGDHNGDGTPDILVGATFREPADSGAAIVFSGLTRGNGVATPLREISGLGWVNNSQTFGHAVAAGRVDGDTIPDIVVGAPLHGPGGRANAGGVWVFSGANGSLLHSLDGQEAGDNLGISVAAADVTDDGRADLAVAASGYDWGGSPGFNYGRVYVYAVPGPAPLLSTSFAYPTSPTSSQMYFFSDVVARGAFRYRLTTSPTDTVVNRPWETFHQFQPGNLLPGRQYLWRFGATANSPDTTHDLYSLFVLPRTGSGIQAGMALEQFVSPPRLTATLWNGTGSTQSVSITEVTMSVGGTTYRSGLPSQHVLDPGSTAINRWTHIPVWPSGSTGVATVRWTRNGINYAQSWQIRFP